MGTYPINAARNLFAGEPIAVHALGARRPGSAYDFHGTVAVTLHFPGERLAQFTVSYETDSVDAYRVAGTEGDILMSPGFTFGQGLAGKPTRNGASEDLSYPSVDQFGAEMRYFSDCIWNDHAPEPDGEEGLADTRILAAIDRPLETGQAQVLPPMQRRTRPDGSQRIALPEIATSKLVNAAKPGG